MRITRRRDAGFAVGFCGALACYNNILGSRSWHRRWYLPANACATVAALAAAAAAGLTAADLGLGRDRLRPGLRLGTRLGGAAAAGWLFTAALPAARPALRDQRVAGLRRHQVAYQALVRIPVGTVLWEETAFRGVAQAALLRVMPRPAALAVASGAFGIWHIRPTAEALRANQRAAGAGRTAAAVTGTCAGMAAAGALLSWLRLRSGSLAAPVVLHLAVNSTGALAAWAASRRRSDRCPPEGGKADG